MDWQVKGYEGPHKDHRLRSDDMGAVYCLECETYLTEDEAEIAWSVETD